MLLLIKVTGDAQVSTSYKLIIDNGKYQESEWCRQLAVTADDKFLLVSDFSSGVKLYDIETGELINMFEGHSLEGDSYYDSKNNLLVTTGDKKIKIWDIATQKLLKQINQGFHSQFMNDVYIDSKRKVVFAEKVKYNYATNAVVKKYSYAKMYFFEDAYYTFNPGTGVISQYNVYDDKLIKNYKISDYQKGYNIFFNERKGFLFIGFSNGVQAVDITSGSGQVILFDRSHTFDNLSICSNFEFSHDYQYFIASSNQGKDNRTGGDGHVAVMKYDSLTEMYKEVYRDIEKTNEIIALNNSNRVFLTRPAKIEFMDLDQTGPTHKAGIWSKEQNLISISRISRTASNIYKLQSGKRYIHLVDVFHALGDGYNENNVLKYFDLIEGANINGPSGWCNFKPGIRLENLPAVLHPLWKERKQDFYLELATEGLRPVSNKKFEDSVFIESSSVPSQYGTVEGENYSPDKTLYAVEESFKGVTYYTQANVKLLTAPTRGVIYHIEYSKDEKYSAFGGSDRTVTVVDLTRKRTLHALPGNSYITSICFSNENKYVFSGSLKNEILMHDITTGKLVRKFTGSNGSITDLEVSSDNNYLLSVADDNALRYWDIKTGNLLVTAYFDYDNNYLAFTSDGYFDKSERFNGKVGYNLNGTFINFDQLYETFYRPDIVKTILRGGRVNDPGITKISKGIKPPPSMELTIIPAGGTRGIVIGKEADDIKSVEVVLKASDKGGGIKGVRLFHNGKLVNENMPDQSIKRDSFIVRAVVELVSGENMISGIGISDDNTESNPVVKKIMSTLKDIQKPDLYIMSIGINDYKNSNYNLNYCMSDMQGFSDAIGLGGNKLFTNIITKKIGNQEATKTNIINYLKELEKKIKPADVFVLFYAGHGIALEKNTESSVLNTDFYYVLYDVTQMTDLNNCSSNGLSGSEMRGLLKNLKANKQILFIDACNSGAFLEQFSIRGAAEENALAKLSRATGSAIFASTTKDQSATEFAELKHGVFTFVLMKALGGEASIGNCQITVASLKSFIDDQIPFYTEKYKGKAQYSTTFMFGQDFPIGIKCK